MGGAGVGVRNSTDRRSSTPSPNIPGGKTCQHQPSYSILVLNGVKMLLLLLLSLLADLPAQRQLPVCLRLPVLSQESIPPENHPIHHCLSGLVLVVF